MRSAFQTVLVRGFDGEEARVALVRLSGRTALVCSVERAERCMSDPEALEDWLVGFPLSDVRKETGQPLGVLG